MLQKKTWLLVTFYTTAGVMALESACKAAGLPGRIVPVPRSITADCGMAWSAPAAERRRLEHAAEDHGLALAGVYELLL